MHIHILGICGSFMTGIARVAREMGHVVTGADANAYPPMSTQLAAMGISIQHGYDSDAVPPDADLVIVGNALTRGIPVIERILAERIPYISGPQWLHQQLLRERSLISIAGTHGKTTTSSMTAWILEAAGLEPGFLIGGMPGNFDTSARLGKDPHFVIEADEYDTAFFDKRAKFVHYPATTLIINNLEHDHVDIYPRIEDIIYQFHHGVRLVPATGHIICAGEDCQHIDRVLAMGCWSTVERTGLEHNDWWAKLHTADASHFSVLRADEEAGEVRWSCIGAHNVRNALSAIAAAAHAGVDPVTACAVLADFKLPTRRHEFFANAHGVDIYLDFAHHPTAVAQTLAALRHRTRGRLLAVVDPRSNTMRAGTHLPALGEALKCADHAWLLARPDLKWDARHLVAGQNSITVAADESELVHSLGAAAQSTDLIVIMSNGDSAELGRQVAASLVQTEFTEYEQH
ncbi:MAG: UDP-N-acetylmuramate:L-alanyl-gamma-D-glutamyl-meso-diaminopimelate ligase [Gammaproteobacteria bacterium]|nr:UDP-N-acetylmuramate:L-alanyl-gamma-D-glutamyl-meso-diaminopimelate ligase [Gammaproteobacteria bacterium]